jgi:hypothetical protein
MSSFNRLPTSIRYLIARLRYWMQPTVWAPLAVLCAGGVFIWEVSVNPERLNIDDEEVAASNSPTSTDILSAEDSAIAAEIDTIPVLVNQFNRSNSEFGVLNSSVVEGKGLFDENRDRGSEIRSASTAPKPATSRTFLPLPSLANPAIGITNNNPPNSSWRSSNPTAALIPSGDGGLISGSKTITPESGGTATTTLSATLGVSNSGKQNANPLPLSPLQAAMKKYIAASTSARATSTQKTASERQLLDRPTTTSPVTNQTNLVPTIATAQNGANPVNIPTTLPPMTAPTNTTINDSQQILNQGATVPESFPGLNLRVPNIPAITAQPATSAWPKNPYQTNLFGDAPGAQPDPIQLATPSPISVVPNVGKSSFPSAIGGSKIQDSQFSPNSANSQFQPFEPNQLNLPSQPSFGVVPQNTNQGVQSTQPQSFATPRSMTPGRYIGGGEINTFANP